MSFASRQTSIADDEIAREQIFEFIKEANKTSQLGPVSWTQALKFLRTKKFNLKGALALYDNYQKTRLSENLVDISPFEIDVCRELLSCKVTVLPSRAADGAAVILVTIKLFESHVDHAAFLRSFVYQLDVLTDKKEIQRNGVVLLVDMTDATYSNVDLGLAMKVYGIVNGAYPARLKNILIFDAPLWFRAAFRTVSTVFRRKMSDRVVFIASLSDLATAAGGREALPSHLGGAAQIDHHAWFEQCLLWHPDSSTVDVPRTLRQASVLGSPAGSHGSRRGSLNVKGLTIAIVQATQPRSQNNLDSEDSESDKEDVSKLRLGSRSNTTTNSTGTDNSTQLNTKGLMLPNELVDYVVKLGEYGIRREYARLRASPPSGSCSVYRKPENISKNRYTDVPCYDSTRVRLSLPGSDSDFIHANFVSLAYQPAALICTQGPLDSTVSDFWAMIWQYQVHVVVMATKLHERGRVKCAAYWPSASGAQLICHPFIVSTMSVDVSNPHWTVSSLSIVDTSSGAERVVFHLFFHGWPDFGIPDVGVFVDFLDVVDKYVMLSGKAQSRGGGSGAEKPSSPDLLSELGEVEKNSFHNKNNSNNDSSGGGSNDHGSSVQSPQSGNSSSSSRAVDMHHSPIVVHCSAGIGRAGTFCAIWHCRHQLAVSEAKTPQVDLMAAIHSVRSMRALAIQSESQFGFCWLAVIEICRRRGLVSKSIDGAMRVVSQLQC